MIHLRINRYLNLNHIALLILIFFALGMQAKAQENSDAFIKKEKLMPPCMVLMSEGLYFDEAEVANIHYLEYLHFVKKDFGKAEYYKSLPDTAKVWPFSDKDVIIVPDGKLDSIGVAYKVIQIRSNYFRNPYYRFFPVVGISHSQATEYC